MNPKRRNRFIHYFFQLLFTNKIVLDIITCVKSFEREVEYDDENWYINNLQFHKPIRNYSTVRSSDSIDLYLRLIAAAGRIVPRPAAFLCPKPQEIISMRFFLLEGGEKDMTINLFFITVTIEMRKPTAEEIEHERFVRQLEEEIKDRKCSVYLPF
jgi:uncharacterized protein (TIGR02413 family)